PWEYNCPGDCHAPASPDSHNRGADKRVWRCRPHEDACSSAPSGRVVPEEALWDARYLVHRGHSEAFASGREKVSARWTVCSWAWWASLSVLSEVLGGARQHAA